MRKRILSLILCLALLVTSAPLIMPMVDAAETELTVEHDGAEVNEISLKPTDKKTLTANAEGLDVLSYRWQILADMNTNLWVNINGETDESCNVSLAMVKSLFDSTGAAYVRCVAELPDGELISDPVCVTEIPEADPLDPPHVTALNVSLPLLQESAPDLKIAGSGAVQTLGATETVTITVKYLDYATMGGEEAAIYTPHIITIESGGSFSDTVTSPPFLGFAPFCDYNGNGTIEEATESATKVKINVTNLTEDKVIKVWYKPVKVPYAIKYYFQNINDDLYQERPELYFVGEAETGTIISNEELQSHAGDTTGFTKLYHIPENVAADGSTTFECYYDRNYYLVQFDLNGGYGVEPIYGRYGTAYIVNDPIRHGWVFKGWDLLTDDSNSDGVLDTGDGEVDPMPATIPATNQYYRAVWETTDTTYKVVYWAQNPSDPDSLAPNAEGATLEHLYTKEMDATSDDLVSGSGFLCGYTEHKHTVEQGCYDNCPYKDHIHAITCYTTQTITPIQNTSSFNDNERTAFNAVSSGTKTDGYVYRYRITTGYVWDRQTTYYNFFYLSGSWYYLGTNDTYNGISVTITNPNNNQYNSAAAQMNCAHTSHSDSCRTCDMPEHTHVTACSPGFDTRHLEFYTADTDVRVEGDGSTVVNVYYRYKEYTFKFYYAATTGTGTDSDDDGILDTYTSVSVITGNTNIFGDDDAKHDTDDDITLLDDNFNSTGEVGNLSRLPKYTSIGAAKNYERGVTHSDSSGRDYHFITFKARYGENIANLWPISIFEPVKRSEGNEMAVMSAWNGEHHVRYSQEQANETIKGKYERVDEQILFHSDFPDSSKVSFLLFWENARNLSWNVPELYVYRIWIQAQAGEDLSGYTTKTKNGQTYKLVDSYDTCDNSTVGEQTQPGLTGYDAVVYNGELDGTEFTSSMTPEQDEVYIRAYYVDLYYKPRSHTLTFNNKKDSTSQTVLYGTDLTDKYYVPEYPSTLEENAYYFDGWCTTSDCYENSKYTLQGSTMPDYDLALYARWAPKTHVVNFYPSYNDMLAGTNLHATKSVEHGKVAGTVANPTYVQNGMDLIFAGWFYMDKGVKKAFTPLNMAVNDDMEIFADWSSSQPQPYQISYVLKDNPTTKVADDTKGFAYGGSTRTFVAKAGDPYNQLYSEYNVGYFPTLASHSITMQYEADKDHPVNNVHTFEYVHAENIAYTVRYVNLETNLVMEEYTTTTQKAVETVRFKAFANMVPDAFYKRLVISVVKDPITGEYVGSPDNVVTFYYSPNTTKAYYAVHYLTEKLGATAAQLTEYKIDGTGGYEMAVAHVEGIGDVNSTIAITPQELPGFELIKTNGVAKTTVGGTNEQTVNLTDGKYTITIKPEGTELYMFYSRNSYDYKVNYYMHNTTDLVDATNFPSKTGTMKYGATLTETAPTIPGYTCVSAYKTQSTVIREKVEQNVINFYYAPVEYVTEYIPVVNGSVPDDMAGWLDRNIEVVDGSEVFKGSKPNTSEHYKFDGWFLDEACTVAVGAKATVDTDNRILPVKAELSETDSNKFYAKFTKLAGDFTITRTGAADENQVFVYQVVNKDNGDTIYVTIKGNGSVTIADLVYGKYTVTQMNGWSWRYSDAAVNNFDHEDDDPEAEVTFSGGASGKWLSGHSDRKHNVKGG